MMLKSLVVQRKLLFTAFFFLYTSFYRCLRTSESSFYLENNRIGVSAAHYKVRNFLNFATEIVVFYNDF